LLYEEERSKVR